MSNEDNREKAAKAALNDIRWLLQGEEETGQLDDDETYLDGPTIVRLLEENFERLDPNNNGIEREELMTALMNPQAFTTDEYEMLRLITKYFDTIINMSDDEEGEETKISRADLLVLEQFLVHSKMTLKELHSWCSIANKPADDIGPPPLSG
ncbi:MAG TPA: hypothetical protein PKD05_06130 [Candidatus Melainabacteria bacterium]|nr:hypothetical protein [Candidatus Melainabacteria bacterium]